MVAVPYWADLLRSSLPPAQPRAEVEAETNALFAEEMAKRKPSTQHDSYKRIPTFHSALQRRSSGKSESVTRQQAEDDDLRAGMRREVVLRRNDRLLDCVLSSDETRALESELEAEQQANGSDYIDYDRYCDVARRVSRRCMRQCMPSAFLKMTKDGNGQAPIMSVYTRVEHKSHLLECFSDFTREYYNPDNLGYITIADLHNYIGRVMAGTPCLAESRLLVPPRAFIQVAASPFLFFHESRKRPGLLRITDIIGSHVTEELLNLQYEQPSEDGGEEGGGGGGGGGGGRGGGAKTGASNSSWFSPENAQQIYSHFLKLDKDGDNMLSPSELSMYSTFEGEDGEPVSSMTETFVQRVFQEHGRAAALSKTAAQAQAAGQVRPGVRKVNHGMSSRKGGAQADALCAGSNLPKDRIDFPSYLQFRLANDFRKTEQGIRYFWNLLDTKHEGFITQFTINYFLREVLSSPFFGGQYEMQDVKDEIFDMLRPADPLKITLADLLSAGVADTVVGIMTDYNGFYLYDQREALQSQNNNEGN